MRTLLKWCVLFSFICSATAHALTQRGVCRLQDTTIDTLTCYGPVIIKNATVTGLLKVAGSVTAINANIGSLDVKGSATLLKTKINGNVDIIGYLHLEDGLIQGSIKATSHKLDLTNSTVVGGIRIKSDRPGAIVTLQKKSEVKEFIEFTDKPGAVHLSPEAKLEREVVNGELIKK